jgi:hypothetical protein
MSAKSQRRRRILRSTPDNFVKYIMRKAANAEQPKCLAYWVAHVSEFAPGEVDCEAGSDFCRECCEKMVYDIHLRFPESAMEYGIDVDGGWGTDHSSPPRCHTCGCKLQGSLTSAGADEEFEALCEYPFDDAESWDALLLVVEAKTRFPMFDSIHTIKDQDADLVEFWRKVAKIVRRAQREERGGK